ncbi:uncharacterized protein LOC113376749 isoform X2 [Ctenocephalides felis]|uniref:uncharacterized protein LOC113376749 isoform X2 n=1 Tax=Ctenocephalides felis TaxID=7515 RepID=UPI000E6E3CE2|nr:uncharacterized protein LOC113376749 isoform X2 [Ctenocephalides felis]
MAKDLDKDSLSSGDKNSNDKPQKTSRSVKIIKHAKANKRASDSVKSENKLENCLQVLKINNQLEQAAAKNNLTAANVRKILKRVVSNEHVLAIVKLKESEKDNEESEGKNANDLLNITPLTRSKVKELQQKDLPVAWPIPVVSPVQPTTTPEVAALINEELPDDSSDEEYKPYDDNVSDDEKESAATASDVESTLNVSANTSQDVDVSAADCDTNCTNNSLFKVPQTSSIDDETIALRTRSKLCLSSTHIETIEKAFIPPDITSDMYDCDDVDGVWKDFLHEFTEPLRQHQEDDEETDPEYNAQVEDIPVDKEELREDQEVTVSRRELSDLVAELLDMNSLPDMNSFCNTIENPIQNVDENQYLTMNENEIISCETQTDEASFPTEGGEADQSIQTITIEVIDNLDLTNSVMTTTQRLILAQQLRQHVQLSTQHFLQLYGHPELWALADICKQNLHNLADTNSGETILSTHNLKPALELCESWQSRLSKDNEETKNIFRFIENEINKSRANKLSHNRYYSKFPPEMMDVICDSKVFIYPELLPKIPFRLDLSNGGVKEFLLSEQQVVAIELHLFYKYMQNNPQLYKKGPRRNYSLFNAVQLIEEYLKNGRSAKTLYRQIRNRLVKSKKDNPIKYYFRHNKPPPTEHILLPFDPDLIATPRKQPVDKLHYIWRTHILKPPVEVKKKKTSSSFVQHPIKITPHKFNESDNLYKVEVGQSFSEDVTIISDKLSETINIIDNNNSLSVCDESVNPPSNSMPLLFASPGAKNSNSNSSPVTPQSTKNGFSSMPMITYISTPINNLIFTSSQQSMDHISKNEDIAKNNLGFHIRDQISPILKNDATNNTFLKIVNVESLRCECGKPSTKKICSKQKLLTDYFTPVQKDLSSDSENHKSSSFQVICKLKFYIKSYFKSLLNNIYLVYNVNHSKKCIKRAFVHILTLDYFFSIYFPKMLPLVSNFLNLQDIKSSPFTSSDEMITDTILGDHDKSNNYLADAEICHLKKPEQRSFVNLPTTKSDGSILHNFPLIENVLSPEYDTVNVYYEHVKNHLCTKNPNDLNRFHEIVMTVNSNDNPSEFYKKLETIFLPTYPHLLKEFLVLLLPNKAERILKFMEICLNSNMDEFVEITTNYLSEHSTQFKKIYIALSELSDIPDVSLCDVISSVLPLVKENAVLKKWFLQLFPCEMLAESDIIDDLHMNLSKNPADDKCHAITRDKNGAVYGGSECICTCHISDDENYMKRNVHCIPCGMKYIQDRICPESVRMSCLQKKSLVEDKTIISSKKRSFAKESQNETLKVDNHNMKTPKKRVKLYDSSVTKVKNIITNNCKMTLKHHKGAPRRNKTKSHENDGQELNVYHNIIQENCDSTDAVSELYSSDNNPDTTWSSVNNSDGFVCSSTEISDISGRTCEKHCLMNADIDLETIHKNSEIAKIPIKRKHKTKKTSLENKDNQNNSKEINMGASINCDIKLVQKDSNKWSRNEDKIILEALQQQIDCEQIHKSLPCRTLKDIKKRSRTLLNILKNLSQ